MICKTTSAVSAGRRHGLALALYTLLAAILTWPLAAHFTTHVTGDGIDDPALAWNLWWTKVRLVDQLNPDIFHADWMFHPVDINLAFYTLTPLNGLISLPLQTAFTLVVANNLILWSSFVLGGYGAHLLALELFAQWRSPLESHTEKRWMDFIAAFLAGVIYAFASSKLFYAALGQFNIASSQWIPFCILYLVRSVRASSLRAAIYSGAMAGLFLVFQAWAELTYATFLLIFIGMFVVWRLFARQLRALIPVLVTGAVFMVGILPFLCAMLPDMRAEGDFFARGGGFADVFSADLMGFLLPTRLHPLFGAWTATLPFPNDKGQQIYIGYTVLVLAALGLWMLIRGGPSLRRWAWLWGSALALFWLLALGPQLRWAGEALPIPGPFALVSRLPFFSGNRYPSRYSVMLMLAAAVLAAAGLLWLLRRGSPRRMAIVCGAIVALVMFEHLSTPLPLSDFRIPAIYDELASEAGAAGNDRATLLELPTGWRNGARVLGKSDILIMMQEWYQTAHGLRRLGGNTSRNPEYKFQYFTQAPLLGDLIALMNADQPHIGPVIDGQLDAMIARDRELAPAVLDFLGVEYVTVHVEKSPPQLLRFVEEALPLALIAEEKEADWTGTPATIRLYRVVSAPASGVQVIKMDDALTSLYVGEGWSSFTSRDGVRYATRPSPVVLLHLPSAGSRLIVDGTGPATALTATVNGQAVSVAKGKQGQDQWTIDVPAGIADQPVDRVQLTFAGDAVSASDLAAAPSPQGWPVGATGAYIVAGSPLVVRSAGQEVGNFAEIFAGGADISANQRGYNLAAIAPDGQILESTAFDTFASSDASAAMAAWLDKWPAGTILAGAVGDEASMHLGPDAVAALQKIGVASDLRDKFRWSHAFIGAAGAAPGSAVEQLSLLAPAAATVGAPVDGGSVYGGLRSITIHPTNQ